MSIPVERKMKGWDLILWVSAFLWDPALRCSSKPCMPAVLPRLISAILALRACQMKLLEIEWVNRTELLKNPDPINQKIYISLRRVSLDYYWISISLRPDHECR